MAERSAVTTRSRRALEPAFPVRPTHAPGAVCDGVAIVGDDAGTLARLRVLRDDIAALWAGGSGDADLLVVAFVVPRKVDPSQLPTALPLVARGATLSSYVAERHVGPRADAARAAPSRVELWWGGQAREIALDSLRAVPLATLWDLPDVTVHRSTAAPRVALATAETRVSHAELAIAEGGIVAFDDTEAALQALHDRTRLGAILRQAWGQMFGGRTVGEDGEAPDTTPGVFENLLGWVRWHTPLGKELIGAFGQRMELVEKLLQSGDVDSALKLALRLGHPDSEPGRTLFPARLPGMRSSLDFVIGGGSTMPILGGGAFESLRGRYAALAASLERQGDHRRAAYIHAQLLGDHLAAVLTLEKGELYADAAKLALDAKLEPVVYIRLFYKAGERDTALALARRSGCFDVLAEDSRRHDPGYHAAVVKAWTDLLLDTGQPLRALQVTDALAATDAVLVERRHDWLRTALEQAGEDAPAELLARLLLTARWTADDLAPDGYDAFPLMTGAVAPFALALEQAQALIRHEGAHAGDDLLALMQSTARLADTKRAEQATFWAGPAPVVVDALVRGIVEGASASLVQRDVDTLTALLRKARQEVFATDLSKLRKLYATPVKPSDDWHLPPPAAPAAPVRHACLLHNGDMVVWRDSSLLQLLDRRGALLWQRPVGDVAALVAVGGGANVIVVQRVPGAADDARRLTRFASHRRRFHEIGTVRLLAHHDVTSDGQWLVQIGGEIGALDLVGLCAETPQIEFLWSCRLTEDVRALGFMHMARRHGWITRATAPGRAHLLEMFLLQDTRSIEARVGRPATSGHDVRILPPGDWFWDPSRGLTSLDLAASSSTTLLFVPWTEQAEREAVRLMAARYERDDRADTIQSGDFGRYRVALPGGTTPARTIVAAGPGAKAERLTLHHAPDAALRCLARAGAAAGDAGGHVLLADAYGRLLRVDLERRSVAIS